MQLPPRFADFRNNSCGSFALTFAMVQLVGSNFTIKIAIQIGVRLPPVKARLIR
jgi:hypothetical protein